MTQKHFCKFNYKSLLPGVYRSCLWAIIVASIFIVPAKAQPLFEDVTDQSGVSGSDSMSAWADYDNDGFTDLMLGNILFHNNGDGTFTKIKSATRPVGPGVWADFDNDGFLDFFRTSGAGELFRNKGNGEFEKIATSLNPVAKSRASAWGDADGDGNIDLLVTNYEDWEKNISYPNVICRNTGNGSFSPPGKLRKDFFWRSRGANWADFDNDGDLDFYISNYRLMPNELYVNDGKGNFDEQAKTHGVAGNSDDKPTIKGKWPYKSHGHTIGSCWGDLNNDGFLDLVVVNFSHQPVYQDRPMVMINNGPPHYTFTDINKKAAAGIYWQESYAKGALGDYDNDGDLDIFITTVYKGDKGTLFENDGTGKFKDVGEQTGTKADYRSYQVAWADYDNDGDLDLLTGGRLFRNKGNDNSWLKVKVVGGAGSNTAGIGARVTVIAGENSYIREIEGGNSGNQNDLVAHFGLGNWKDKVTVKIRFPSGKVGNWTAKPSVTLIAKECEAK